jgi:hypothetical protein
MKKEEELTLRFDEEEGWIQRLRQHKKKEKKDEQRKEREK